MDPYLNPLKSPFQGTAGHGGNPGGNNNPGSGEEGRTGEDVMYKPHFITNSAKYCISLSYTQFII